MFAAFSEEDAEWYGPYSSRKELEKKLEEAHEGVDLNNFKIKILIFEETPYFECIMTLSPKFSIVSHKLKK